MTLELPTRGFEVPNLYSQRMLHPFHGIVNVVEIPGADAVSRDGVIWSLYIQGGVESEKLDDGGMAEVPLPDIKFGTWSAGAGLKRAPVRYVTDCEYLDWIGAQLLDAVKAGAENVPLPQRDVYELWLLDKDDGQPLALLQSSCDGADTGSAETRRWNPGQAARQSFRPTGTRAGEASDIAPAEDLAQRVNAAAGQPARTQWFARGGDGSGHGLACSQPGAGLLGRQLDAVSFPELLLRERWDSDEDAALVASFLSWQAPWLLSLQTLSRHTRRRLEASARQRALLVAQLYVTYSEIIDPAMIRAARVEAKLRQSADVPVREDETPATTFFVTGN